MHVLAVCNLTVSIPQVEHSRKLNAFALWYQGRHRMFWGNPVHCIKSPRYSHNVTFFSSRTAWFGICGVMYLYMYNETSQSR